jgi:hypothetical protein
MQLCGKGDHVFLAKLVEGSVVAYRQRPPVRPIVSTQSAIMSSGKSREASIAHLLV